MNDDDKEFQILLGDLERQGMRLVGGFQCIYCGKFFRLENFSGSREHLILHKLINLVKENESKRTNTNIEEAKP